MKNKKGQTSGIVNGLIFGIASLVIAVIIAFVITSTVGNANLLDSGRTSSTVTNETSWLNATTYTLANAGTTTFNYALTAIWANTSTVYETVPLANATVSTAGVVTRAGSEDYSQAKFTYTYSTYSGEELAEDKLSANFTEGVDEVSKQVPTVLLIGAIILILAVLAILVFVWQKMRMDGNANAVL